MKMKQHIELELLCTPAAAVSLVEWLESVGLQQQISARGCGVLRMSCSDERTYQRPDLAICTPFQASARSEP
ncbi:MAG: hypothetical protein AB7O62_00150 [Pirellulales bacterium]